MHVFGVVGMALAHGLQGEGGAIEEFHFDETFVEQIIETIVEGVFFEFFLDECYGTCGVFFDCALEFHAWATGLHAEDFLFFLRTASDDAFALAQQFATLQEARIVFDDGLQQGDSVGVIFDFDCAECFEPIGFHILRQFFIGDFRHDRVMVFRELVRGGRLCKGAGDLASLGEKNVWHFCTDRSKNVFDAVDVGFFALGEDDFDDIEAPRHAAVFEELEPGVGTAFDEFEFGAVDGIEWSTDSALAAGFDLDEKQQIAVAGDDIHFATLGRTVVAVENFGVVRTEPSAGDALAVLADFMWRPAFAITMRQAATRVEIPAEMSDDECDKGHERGGRRGVTLYHSPCVFQIRIRETLGRIVS